LANQHPASLERGRITITVSPRKRSRDRFARAGRHGGDAHRLARGVPGRREAALTTRAATGEELESDRLKARLGAALIERDLLHEKIALLEADRPFARRRRKP
jgi:hypothetical protein